MSLAFKPVFRLHENRMLPTLALLLVCMSGCSFVPREASMLDIQTAAKPPQKWTASYQDSSQQPQNWLKDFVAPELPALVDKAMQFNRSLDAARARMNQSRARSVISRESIRPAGSASTNVSRSYNNGNASSNFDIGAVVSWEPDVWGRLQNNARATEFDAQAAGNDFASARLSLAATVTRNWFAAVENQLQIDLAKRTLDSFKKSLETIESRYRGGLGSALDVRLARSNVANAENTLAARQRELDASLRGLEVLVGDYPAAALKTSRQLPQVRTRVPAGLPSGLLNRRPDLAAANLRLQAAQERLESARKNRLPSFRLTSSSGTSSRQLKDLLDWDSLALTLLGGVTQPILQGKRLKTEEQLVRYQRQEEWADYVQAVLTAFNEVETTLAADAYFARQEVALKKASQEAREAVELATQRYTSGLENITTLLESQRRMINAESALLQTRLARLDSRVRLYLALGGDFSSSTQQLKQEKPS